MLPGDVRTDISSFEKWTDNRSRLDYQSILSGFLHGMTTIIEMHLHEYEAYHKSQEYDGEHYSDIAR